MIAIAAAAHKSSSIGHSFAAYFTISDYPDMRPLIVPKSTTLFLPLLPLEQLEFIRLSNFRAEPCSAQPIRPRLCSHATSKVDIDDISFTLNFSFKSFARDDLLINFLVSVFTSYKNKIGRIQSRKHVFLHDIKIRRYQRRLPEQRYKCKGLFSSNARTFRSLSCSSSVEYSSREDILLLFGKHSK